MKHHYIPQFYLRPWVSDTDNKLQEFRRCSNGKTETVRVSTKQTGYAVNLYTVPGATEETKHNVEKYFMGLVDNEAVAARNMMLTGRIPVDPKIRYSWVRFLFSIAMRNPEELERFKASFIHHWNQPHPELHAEYQRKRRTTDPPTLEEWVLSVDPTMRERQALLIALKLMQHEKGTTTLRRMHWRLYDTNSIAEPLMTSDRPLAMTNGLMQYQAHIALPISPRMLFMAFTLQDFASEVDSMPRWKLVRGVNDAVISQARRHVYALDDKKFRQVRNRMSSATAPRLLPSMIAR